MRLLTRADQIPHFVQGPSVLDVGCAGGLATYESRYWLHGQLLERFPQVAGIDNDEVKVRELTARGYEHVTVADAEAFRLDATFDTVVAADIIEHLENPGSFLRCAAAHLKEHGQLLITTPYPFALLFSLYAVLKFPHTCSSPYHTCWYCPVTLTTLAGRCGLEVVHWQLVEDYRPDLASGWYRLFYRGLSLVKPFCPRRLRCNALLFQLRIAT